MNSYLTILIGSILVNNYVMNKFMGICPFLGVSKKVDTALGMGMAVTFVMTLKKLSFSLYQALGVYLPLITTNCAVLGAAILNSDSGYNLLESTLSGCSAALGFTLALLLMAGIRERLALSRMPKWMDGFPGALITAGLMAVSFMGFGGLIK